MAEPLPIGTAVVVLSSPLLDGEASEGEDVSMYAPTRSEPTTIVAVQWVNPEGEIVDEPQEQFQYLLDAEDPYPDTAVRPEYVEAV